MKGNTQPSSDALSEYTVAIVISTHIIGGPAKGLLQLLPELTSRQRVRPVLCTFKKAGDEDTPFIQICKEKGIPLVLLEQRFNLDPRPYGQLKRLMEAERIDILQTHGYKENFFGLFLKWRTGKRWICFLHGTTNENLKVRFYHLLDSFLVRSADRIVSVSQELAHRIVPRRHFHKVRIVENAISANGHAVNPFLVANWKRRMQVQKANVIACIGRLSPEKGQDLLLDAASRLANDALDFQILLVGDGPNRARLEAACRRRDLGKRVLFLGAQKQVEMVYAATDILVLPSYNEGMPNVILEAMQYGLPIVATRVGAVPDMLTDHVHALLVPPANPVALYHSLKELLTNAKKAARLGRAAKATLFPRFSIAHRTEKMERLYEEVIKEK